MTLDFVPVFDNGNLLLWGATNTVWIAILGMLLALLTGTLAAAGSALGFNWLRRTIAAYVYFIRGTPLLTQLIAAFYLPSLFGYNIPAAVVGVLCLGIYFGAYTTEIMRAAVEAIPSDQIDVARSFGMPTFLLYRRIVLPQVVGSVIPPLAGQFTSLLKATSLLSIITIQELTFEGRIIIIRTIAPLETYIVIGGIYFLLNSVVVASSVKLEQHYRRFL